MTKDSDKLLTEASQKVRQRMIDAKVNDFLNFALAPRFNIQEVSLATGMSTSAIRRLIKAGKIEVTRNPTTLAYEMTVGALIDAGLI